MNSNNGKRAKSKCKRIWGKVIGEAGFGVMIGMPWEFVKWSCCFLWLRYMFPVYCKLDEIFCPTRKIINSSFLFCSEVSTHHASRVLFWANNISNRYVHTCFLQLHYWCLSFSSVTHRFRTTSIIYLITQQYTVLTPKSLNVKREMGWYWKMEAK